MQPTLRRGQTECQMITISVVKWCCMSLHGALSSSKPSLQWETSDELKIFNRETNIHLMKAKTFHTQSSEMIIQPCSAPACYSFFLHSCLF